MGDRVKSKKVISVLTIALLVLNLFASFMLSLSSLPAVAAASETQPLFANIEYARYNISKYRLLIIVLDAVRYDFVTPKYMPFIVGYLKPRSLWMWGYTLLRSETRPFRAFLASGAPPWFTGIDTNGRTSIWSGLRTIVDIVHDMGYTTLGVFDLGGYAIFSSSSDAVWTIGRSSSFTDWYYYGTTDWDVNNVNATINTLKALELVDAHPDWRLLWVEYHAPDIAGHTTGWGSVAYANNVTWVDAEVKKLLEGLEDRGMLNETVILITTDHGGHGTTHGDVIEYDMRIWGLIHVPDEAIVGEYEFASPLSLTATVAYLMGIPLSEYATGTVLVGEAKPRYVALNILGTSPPDTTPVILPNGTVVDADHLIVSNGIVTMLFSLLNDTEYSHDLGAVTYSYLVANPSTGHQFVGYTGDTGANPTRSDIQNSDLPNRLNTLYTSTDNYFPTTFVLFNDPGDLSGNGRSITGSDFGEDITSPSNDLVERNLTIEEYGSILLLKYYARFKNAGFTSSFSMETNVTTYVIPNVPFVIHEVTIKNLDTVDITGLHPGIRAVVETTYTSAWFTLLNQYGEIAAAAAEVSSIGNYDGYWGTAVTYNDTDTGHSRLVRGFFFLEFDSGTPRMRVGSATFNAMVTGVTISPGESFRYVVIEFTGFSKEDIPEITKLAKSVWSIIKNHGVETLSKMFAKASPLVAVRYVDGDAYPVHLVADWGYDPSTVTARAVVYAPTGTKSIIEIQAPHGTNAVLNIECNATEYDWYFDKNRRVVVIEATHSSAVEVVVTFTTKEYVTPITIKDVSGKDWTDRVVLIELNSSNFADWGLLSETGEDIYVTDEAGNPLYYWVGIFDKYNQRALIYVRLPNLPANGYTVINLHYGSTNPYENYRDPSKVFDWLEDFEVWEGWIQYGDGVVEQSSEYVFHGNYSLKKHTNADPNGGYKPLGFTLNTTFVLEAWIFRASVDNGNADRIGVVDDNGNGYGFNLAHSAGEISVDRRDSWSGTVYASVSLTRDPMQEWYLGRLIWYSDGRIVVEAYDISGNLLGRTEYTDTTYNTFTNVYVLGDSTYYVDFMRIYYPIDPSPKIFVGWKPGLKGNYMVPITISERSGTDVSNYVVVIQLDRDNFPYWEYFATENGSDIYFLDSNREPLYYAIEYFNINEKKATIRVFIPSLPANSNITIYMYLGSTNPYESYRVSLEQLVSMAALFIEDFETLSTGSLAGQDGYYSVDYGNAYSSGAIVVESNGAYNGTKYVHLPNTATEMVCKDLNLAVKGFELIFYIKQIDTGNTLGVIVKDSNGNWVGVGINVPDGADDNRPVYATGADSWSAFGTTSSVPTDWMKVDVKFFNNAYISIAVDGQTVSNVALSYSLADVKCICILDRGKTAEAYIDLIMLLPYVYPEPAIEIGELMVSETIRLLEEGVIYQHNITYMPNSTQFSHSFTATNTTTAGYEVNYTSPYGWRVYASPYEVNGTYYENNASLVSELGITLPYGGVLVEKVVLYAKANGTGSYRQLWIKVLDQNNATVVELTNATIGTDWTEVVIDVNASLSAVRLWINATVASTNTSSEEIAIKDVKVFVVYTTNLVPEAQKEFNKENLTVIAYMSVELGSVDFVNTSTIMLKIIDKLQYSSTDYPVEPVLVGTEAIGSRNYTVYEIDPALDTGSYKLYMTMPNVLKGMAIRSKGVVVATVLVNERVELFLPEIANVTIKETGQVFLNVSKLYLRFMVPGTFTIQANVTRVSEWKLGFWSISISVIYGKFSVKPIDLDGLELDYETLTVELLNATTREVVASKSGDGIIEIGNLIAGNYTIRLRFKDIVLSEKDFELTIHTHNSIQSINVTAKKIVADYRGQPKHVIVNKGVELLNITDVDPEFKYSRMSIALNGTGSFKLYINYVADLPTKVAVEGNVSGLKYYWDGKYLVVEGSLGSVGVINVTDLYKIRLEIYDRLGNRLPLKPVILINGTSYAGPIVEDYLYPENYVIELPTVIGGFDFYSYFDGYNQTVRTVTINHTDVTLKIWYRVPTSLAKVKGVQITSLSWLPFLKQDGETVKVYVEGYLLDYYGHGVPNRPVVINITDVEAGFTWMVNATTDATGYFRTPLLELVRGRTYRIDVCYAGDDIYVGTSSTMEVKPEELPSAPAPVEIPMEYIIIGAAAALILIGIAAAAIKAVRQTIEDLRAKSRRFVRKK